MQKISWTDKDFGVGITDVDDQHKILIGIFNQTLDACALGKSSVAYLKLIKQLLDYTNSHFSHEEQLMKKSGYPELNHHISLHKNLSQQAWEFYEAFRLEKQGWSETKEFQESQLTESKKFAIFMTSWLNDHIKNEDITFGTFYKELKKD